MPDRGLFPRIPSNKVRPPGSFGPPPDAFRATRQILLALYGFQQRLMKIACPEVLYGAVLNVKPLSGIMVAAVTARQKFSVILNAEQTVQIFAYKIFIYF